MSLLRKAAVFVAKEIASSAAGEVGRHVGDAIGNLLGKRIDPEHGKVPADDAGEKGGKKT